MVTRVWGRADSYELVFSPSGAYWQASVPADMQDGQYAVELYCVDDGGNTAYWTGMLYLNKSELVKVRIVEDKLKLWMVADIEVELSRDQHIWLQEERIQLTMTCLDFVGRG